MFSIGTFTKEITSANVDGWLSTNGDRLKPGSVSNYIAYYNSFAKYLNSLDISAFVMEPPLSKRSYVPYVFSSQEVLDIFRIADNRKNRVDKLTPIQFPMFLRLLYGCGLRLKEVLKLNISDIDLTNGVLCIKCGKGNIDRLVPMDEALTDILKLYCDAILAKKPSTSYLFESEYKDGRRDCIGRPRSPMWAQHNFQYTLKLAGINPVLHPTSGRNVCLHCLRHTFAVHSFRKQDLAGIDNYQSSPLLSKYLGHRFLTGTQKYLHMTAENSEDIITLTTEYSVGLFPEVPR